MHNSSGKISLANVSTVHPSVLSIYVEGHFHPFSKRARFSKKGVIIRTIGFLGYVHETLRGRKLSLGTVE